MIIDRLVFGSARLTGGLIAREAAALVMACVDAGVRHVDTAPSYGIGTAEAVIGNCLADRPDVRVTTKIGSIRPRHALAKTWLRAAKRLIVTRPPQLNAGFEPVPAPSHSRNGDFSLAAMARSLDESRRLLRRDTLDLLLLHDIYADDISEEVISFVDEVRRVGVARELGYANGALFDPILDRSFPGDFVAQTAIPPEALAGRAPPELPQYLHSIPNTSQFLIRTDDNFARGLQRVATLVPASVADPQSAALAVCYAITHARFPDQRLIFASIDAGRLSAFLRAVSHIDREVDAEAVGNAFAEFR